MYYNDSNKCFEIESLKQPFKFIKMHNLKTGRYINLKTAVKRVITYEKKAIIEMKA
jgi:hypothetical protein